jgi:NAD(P)-dependent dehydrogenase (short-subunit alcohol dehydrogenase family)
MKSLSSIFSLDGKVVVITGGGGMLAYQHASAIISFGGIPVLIDINEEVLKKNQVQLKKEHGSTVLIQKTDITKIDSILESHQNIISAYGRLDVLINNASRNPKVEESNNVNFSRLENFSEELWNLDIDVGLGGAYRCAKVYGSYMADCGRGGVILNISSDLGVIAPDQRLYKVAGLSRNMQPVKPVTYSVVKHGLLGLTKYLATYWCDCGIRCNALSPGGVYNGQNEQFLTNIQKLIPMGRMANPNEYQGAVVFLCSDASTYLNGANLIIDGGRSVW